MRYVDVAGDGVLELRWMWLPSFMAQDFATMKKLQDALNEKYANKDLESTSLMLDNIDRFIVDWLVDHYKISFSGLKEYLLGLRHIRMEGDNDAIPIQQEPG